MNRLQLFFPNPVFDVPGGAPGGAPAPAPAAVPGSPGAPSAPPAGSPPPGADGGAPEGHFSKPYHPEGLADPFRGKSDQETIDRLSKAARVAPEKADAYKLELAPDVQKHFKADLAKDPVFLAFRDAAHAHGLDQKQFNGLFGDIIKGFDKAGVFAPPIDTKAELTKLAGTETDPIKATAKAEQRIIAARTWIENELARGTFTKEEAGAADALRSVADGISFLEKVMAKFSGGQGLNPGGQPGAQGPTREQLQQDMRDPRYDSLNPKYDKAYRQRVDEAYRNASR